MNHFPSACFSPRCRSIGRSWIAGASSEPVVADALPVARQVFERVEALEMVDREVRDGARLGQAEVDGDAAASFLVGFERAPVGDATALGAEMELDRLAADVHRGRSRDMDAFVLVVVCP